MGAEAVCPYPPPFFFRTLRRNSFGVRHRMKHSLRRRNASEKRNGFARKKSVDWRRSANGSGGRRRSSSVPCAKKWSGFNARRGIGLLLGAVAVCGVYAVHVHLCVPVPQQEVAREQVHHFSPLVLRIEICKNADVYFHAVLGSISSTTGGHTKAPSGSAVGPSKIARPSSVAVSSARGTTSIPRGVSKRSS